MTYQQIELFGRDLPDHAHHLRMYTVIHGLDAQVAETLENRAARIITLGRRAILDIGMELVAARKEAAHGTWGAFLARCGLGERTAQNYINVVEKFADRPEVFRLLPPTALYAMAADSADQAGVEAIIADAQNGAAPTVAEVQEKVRGKPRTSWLYCANCNAAVKQLYGARGVCLNCWQSSSEPKAEPPEPTPTTAVAHASKAEGCLLDAQNAGPGSRPRANALHFAWLTLPYAPEADRAALTIRYHELRREHAAAIAASGSTDVAGILQLMGWLYVQGKNGGIWRDPQREHEVEFSNDELPIAARLVLAHPDMGTDELCRLVKEAMTPAATSAALTTVQPAQPASPDIPRDIQVWAHIYGMSVEYAVHDDVPAVWLLWPGDDKESMLPVPLDEAAKFLRFDVMDMALNRDAGYAPTDCLFLRAQALHYDVLDVTADGRLEVAHEALADGTTMTAAELEARIGGPSAAPEPTPATPSRADVAQWIDLCDQATNAYRSGDGAHALRCLWQMATIAAGSVREAREWAARNAA